MRRRNEPQVVGPVHSSYETLETEPSEGAGLFKCWLTKQLQEIEGG